MLVFSLPFFHKFSNLIIVLIFFLSLIDVIKKRALPPIYIHWFLPLLFFYYVVSELVTGHAGATLEKKFLLFLIPFAFAMNPDFRREHLRPKIYLSFIVGNLLAIVICLGRAVIRSMILKDGSWIFNPKVIQDSNYDFLTSSVMGGNYFFGEEFSFFLHSTYAGIYIVFGQYLVFEIFKLSPGRRNKQLLIACYLFFLFALFLLSSKAAILSSFIISFWILLRVKLPRFIKIAGLACFVLVCVLFLFFNPRLKVFKETLTVGQLFHPDPNAQFGHDLRILSWDASLDVIRDHWLMGVGEGNKTSALVKVYTDKGYIVPAQKMFNCHNQYLEFLVGGGLLGFGLFMAGLITLWVGSVKEKNNTLLALLVIFAFNALFESLLDRHAGILFFSLFVSLLAARRESLSTQPVAALR